MIIIRIVTIDDIQSIKVVAYETWISTYKEIYPMDFILNFLNVAYSTESLTQAIERDTQSSKRKFLVAEESNQLVGYAQVRQIDKDEFELLRIYVSPKFQGQGIGTMFIEEFLRTLQPVRFLHAWVEKDNELGKAFYTKRNFNNTEEKTEIFEGRSINLLKYELKIN